MADPTYRMSMLPFGTYANPDGTESLGLAVPGMIQEPINALMRLAENSRLPDGRLGIPNPDNAQNREDVLTGLLSMYGGNAMNPGRLMKGAAAKAAPEAAREAPYAMYRGAPNSDGLFPTDRPLFMSSSPEVAGTYAGMVPDGPGVGSVAPAQANFVNPMVVDAQGRAWNDIPFNGNWIDSNALTYWARDAGHDGLVIKNVTDHLGAPGSVAPADTVVALKRGTVTSPLTGEMLFSDTGRPSLFGSAIAGAERNAPGFDVWHGSPHDFDKFELSKIGSGEGAQAFGHGLYFAENPNVAKGYQADLASAVNTPEMTAAKVLDYHGGDLDDALNYYGRLIDSAYADRNIDHARDLLRGKAALASPSTLPSPGGYLYQARIKADPGQFLDWETLSPEAQAQMKTQEGAAAYRDQGYHGIRYFDHGSRAGNEGTRNYVVFDDSIVNTIHKWRGDQQLYSDGLPSIWGNALAPYQDEPRNALLNY